MKPLGGLISALPVVLESHHLADTAIRSVVCDSRQVEAGALFVAIPGVEVDGHQFIPQALARGAVAVVGERSYPPVASFPEVPYIRVPDAREALAWLSAAWHNYPARRLVTIGVTGTDGKTTTSHLIYSILRAAGYRAGAITTVEAYIGGEVLDTGLHTTTPDAPMVQALLARMAQAGVEIAVLETTSHGLAQHRVTACEFDVGVVTNVTPEHLDYHGSYARYLEDKGRLFRHLQVAWPKGVTKTAILNADDRSFEPFRAIPVERQWSYALEREAEITARSVEQTPRGIRLVARTPRGEFPVESPLIGRFNVYNILAAIAVGLALEIPLEAIRQGIAEMCGVPGRMELIDEGQPFTAIVDFAHTPNALAQALRTVRPLARGRVIVVFGCAGRRDPFKRPEMGRIAGQLADVVVLTAEDPRTEPLEEIMEQSARAAREVGKRDGETLFLVPDRGEALRLACQIAEAGDVVIACGKGHEQSMCFGTTEYPWDDRKAMRLALRGETLDTLPTARRWKGAC